MVLISYSGREINAKLVYYGPGLSGKTTNLEFIYGAIPQTNRGKMVSMKTKTERTLFFDFLPIDLGELSGFKTRFLLYTVPGQVYYNATRKLVLKGVDAIVFVADSKRGKMDENIESLQNLRENLREHGIDLDKMPWVIQYNKRDLPDVYSIEELERTLNPGKVPSFEAVGTTGVGVFETFKAMSRMLLKHLAHEIGVRVVASPSSPPAVAEAHPPAAAEAPPPIPIAAPPPPTIALAPHPLPVRQPVVPSPSLLRDPAPEETPRTIVPLRLEPVAPPPPRERVEPAEPLVADQTIPPAAEEPSPREEIELVVENSEHSFDRPPTEGSPADAVDGMPDELDRRQGVGGRLRRWFGRARDADESEFTVEMDVNRETVTRPTTPEPSIRPEGATAYPSVQAPVPTDAACSEPRWREVPILVDLEPDDLERGVVLKLRICVRRSNESSGEEPEGERLAA